MQKRAGKLIYSPSDLVNYLKSPFGSWMDRLLVERPGAAEPDPDTEENRLIAAKGDEHERAWLAELRTGGVDVVEIARKAERPDPDATRKALAEGRQVIYQAALAHGEFAGYADFLERREGGAANEYDVVDTKLARTPKPYFILQLCAYAEMLEAMTGRRPREIHVVLGDGKRKPYRTDDYFYAYRELKRRFLAHMASFDPERRPEPDPGDDHGKWESVVEAWVEEHDHLSRVATITRTQICRLEAVGVRTMAALADGAARTVPKLAGPQLDKLRAQARLQRASPDDGPPAYKLLPIDAEEPRRGLALLPPASPGDAWIDFEGFPLVDEGLEYLFGAVTADGGKPQFHDWWAHDRAQEKNAFEGFVDFVYDRWRRDRSMHLFHYAAYEVTALRKLMGRHATREVEVDALLRGEVFVDLYHVVRQGIRVGTPRYSLKDVERLFRPRREGHVASGAASIVAYHAWRESGEPGDPAGSPRLRQIRDYNEEDCDSTRLLTEWLWARQKEQGIAWIPPKREDEDPVEASKIPEDDQESAALAAELLAELPEDRAARESDRWRLQEILAQILEFHRREQKPMFWAKYDRSEMSHEELAQEASCLGNLRLESPAGVIVKKSTAWWYAFEPDQDTKLDTGDGCFFSHDLSINATIESLDREAGRVLVKLGPTAIGLMGGRPPQVVSLIPDEFVTQDVLKHAIRDLVKEWRDSGRLPRHIEDVLLRRRARIRGQPSGSLLRDGEAGGAGAVRIGPLLDETTLCIQGPPGTGKTRTGVAMILDLVRRGQRVGITATGHAAIENLMQQCCERAGEGGLACLKVASKEPKAFLATARGCSWKSSEKAALATDVGLVGGTAWFFARPDVVGTFDYVFVEEAGQFSLANLVAVARSCRNFVLLGDQLQLGQPTQGAHPGDSGKSALDYLLRGQATVAEDFGIFLARTYRLHPKICGFISGAIYENRLEPMPENVNRVVRVPRTGGSLVPIDAGMLFVPVEHDGCTQASDDEVEVIGRLFEELVGRERVGSEGKVSRITDQDILVVAPYNMQVRKLKAALPGARIGSVDKFQGQQAPIVIVSMCASEGESSPRGIDFLFDRSRLNVAISRAQSLAIVVGSPRLAATRCSTIPQMERLNTFCRIVEEGSATRR